MNPIPADLNMRGNAADLLAWLRTHYPQSSNVTGETVTLLGALSAVGVTHLHRGDTFTYSVRQMLNRLAAAGSPVALDVDAVALLPVTGWRVWHHGVRDEWAPVIAVCAELPTTAQQSPGDAIDAWIAAGRTPEAAIAVCSAARETDAYPLLYGPLVTASQYRSLAAAEVTDAEEVAAYQRAGLTLEQAGTLALARVPAGACLAGVELEIPTAEWVDVFAGWHKSWVPLPDRGAHEGWSPVAQGLPGHGWPLAALTALAKTPWATLSSYSARNGLRTGSGRRPVLHLTPDTALTAAATGLSIAQVSGYYDALATSGKGSDGAPRMTPWKAHQLFDDAGNGRTLLDVMVDLAEREVKPVHLSEFRQCGCHSVDDVLAAVDAGISGPIAKRLRTAHGARSYRSARPRFATLTDLLEAHVHDSDARTHQQ